MLCVGNPVVIRPSKGKWYSINCVEILRVYAALRIWVFLKEVYKDNVKYWWGVYTPELSERSSPQNITTNPLPSSALKPCLN
jgi:hypothetical protein